MNRPKLKIQLSLSDKLIEGAGWVLLFFFWGFTLVQYSYLTDTIPVHFDASGKPDGFGGKGSIWDLPIVATVIFTGLTLLNKFPHIFNYPTQITPENALEQYQMATRMIRFLKLVLVVIFNLIAVQTIRHAKGETEGLGIWLLPLTLGLIFIPLFYYLGKAMKS
jgi:uncharacterized membrane protein